MSGLLWESEEHQVNTLLYCLGEETKNILASTNIGEEDKEIWQCFGKVWQFL